MAEHPRHRRGAAIAGGVLIALPAVAMIGAVVDEGLRAGAVAAILALEKNGGYLIAAAVGLVLVMSASVLLTLVRRRQNAVRRASETR